VLHGGESARPVAELTVDDVIQYTQGRLADDDETARMLAAALAAARQYCGWHVSPVKTGVDLVVDGPCSRILALPTRKLLDVTAVTEDTIVLDIAALEWSQIGSVRKTSGAYWSCTYQSIAITIDHGFTEVEAADWRDAVLSAVNRASLQVAGRQTAGPYSFTPESSLFSDAERDKLDPYRLLVL